MDHNGAEILVKLLLEDPSIHLLAIILVNLSFCDAPLRTDLANIIPSLAYTLKVSTMSPSDFETFDDVYDTVEEKLKSLLTQEQSLRPATSDLDFNQNTRGPDLLLLPDGQVYPETARWCLAALKNLTRPPSTLGCEKLIASGILPLILQIITLGGSASTPLSAQSKLPKIPEEEGKRDEESHINSTRTWDSDSIQDAALYIVMNVASVQPDEVAQNDGVHILSLIADYQGVENEDADKLCQIQFQSIKAVSKRWKQYKFPRLKNFY
jgi:hypothetical protein